MTGTFRGAPQTPQGVQHSGLTTCRELKAASRAAEGSGPRPRLESHPKSGLLSSLSLPSYDERAEKKEEGRGGEQGKSCHCSPGIRGFIPPSAERSHLLLTKMLLRPDQTTLISQKQHGGTLGSIRSPAQGHTVTEPELEPTSQPSEALESKNTTTPWWPLPGIAGGSPQSRGVRSEVPTLPTCL